MGAEFSTPATFDMIYSTLLWQDCKSFTGAAARFVNSSPFGVYFRTWVAAELDLFSIQQSVLYCQTIGIKSDPADLMKKLRLETAGV